MGSRKMTPLHNVTFSGGPEIVTLKTATLVMTTDDAGWKSWHIHTTEPVPYSLFGVDPLEFASGRFSGRCFLQNISGRFAGSGLVSGYVD